MRKRPSVFPFQGKQMQLKLSRWVLSHNQTIHEAGAVLQSPAPQWQKPIEAATNMSTIAIIRVVAGYPYQFAAGVHDISWESFGPSIFKRAGRLPLFQR